MRVVVGTDHAGFELKGPILDQLKSLGHSAIDVGTNSTEAVDYPDIARSVAETILDGKADVGILLCGSGVRRGVVGHTLTLVTPRRCHVWVLKPFSPVKRMSAFYSAGAAWAAVSPPTNFRESAPDFVMIRSPLIR